MTSDRNPLERVWAEVVAKVWREGDDVLRHKIVTDPRPTLAALGVDIPDDVEIHVHEDSPKRVNLVLPPKPTKLAKLDEQDTFLYAGCPCTVCATGGGTGAD